MAVSVPVRDLSWRAPAASLAAALAASALGLGAVFQPLMALAAVLGLFFVAIALVDLSAGLTLFVILIFFERIPGLDSSGFTFVKVAGAVLALSWLLAVGRRGSTVPFLVRDHPLLAYAAVALVTWTLMSQLWATDVGRARSSAVRLMQVVILLFIVYSAVRDRRHVRWMIWAFVIGAFVTALVGLAGGSSAESFDVEGGARLTGGLADPNEFAAILVPALWFSAFALVTTHSAFLRWLLATFGIVLALALFLTESRGGILALAVTAVAAVVFAGPMRAKAIAAVLVVGALGISYYTLVAPPESLQRITEFSAGGGTGRTDLWSIALEMAGDHPVLGVGSGNFVVVEPSYATRGISLESIRLIVDTPLVAHNTYLHILAELGIVGLALFLAVVVGAFSIALRAVRGFARHGDLELELRGRALLIGMTGMLAAYGFLSAQYEKQLWLLLGVATSLGAVLASQLAPRPVAELDGIEEPIDAEPELPTTPHYDLPVSERLVEQLERRFSERLDTLLAEQQRLERRRAALAAREQEFAERSRLLESVSAAPSEEAEAIGRRTEEFSEREAALAEAEAEVERRAALLHGREQALIRLAGELRVREAAAASEAPVAPPPSVATPGPAPTGPPPSPSAPVASLSELPTLAELDRRVHARGGEFPERADEWRYYLLYLRDYANAEGVLPASFDALVDEVFGELLDRR